MLAMIGAFLGWKMVLLTLTAGSVLGSVVRSRPDCQRAGRHGLEAAVRLLPGGGGRGGRDRGAADARLVSGVFLTVHLTAPALHPARPDGRSSPVWLACWHLRSFVFSAAAAAAKRQMRGGSGADTALLSAALQEAVTKLKAQEARDPPARRRRLRTPQR